MKLFESVMNKGFSKEESIVIIKAGEVFVNNEINMFPHFKIQISDVVLIKKQKEYVSRGAYKLLKAIDVFEINVKDKVVVDIGSSTGGFTEICLINGARKVYAIDSGTNQLDYKIRKNEKVFVKEKTNLKSITIDMFDEEIDLFVCDVSFISLKEVFKVIQPFNCKAMLLIKPQFEAKRQWVQHGGIVEKKWHNIIIQKIKEIGEEYSWELLNYQESPIKGKKSKNIEYISNWRKNGH